MSPIPQDYQVPWQLPVQIGGRQYFIDPAKYARNDLPALRPQVDQSQQPGEQTLNAEGSWVRSQTDWTLGGQQETFDDETATPRRYWLARDVQPLRRGRIQLSNALQQRSTADGDCNAWSWNERSLIQVGTSLYLLDFASPNYRVKRFSISSGPYSAISVTTDISSATACLVLATDGVATTWVARGASGVSRATSVGGAFTAAWSSVATNSIAYCNGRLIGMSDASLFELDSSGAKVGSADIYTHPTATWDWRGAVAGAGAIFVWGDPDTGGYPGAVYALSDVISNGALAPPKIALPMPPGEVVKHLEPIAGYFVMRTNLGVRVVEQQGDVLIAGPLITHSNYAADHYPSVPMSVSAYADGVMVAWRNVTVQPDWIARLDLANFTDSGVPAMHQGEYTADDAEATVGNQAIRCALVVNRPETQYQSGQLWVVGGDTALTTRRVWAASINFAPNGDSNGRAKASAGHFWSGWITYGLTEPKQLTSVSLVHDEIPDGAKIDVYSLHADLSSTTLLGTTAEGSTFTTIPVPASLHGPERRFALGFFFTRGTTNTDTPVLHSWAARAMPIPLRQEEIILPIVLEERVTSGDDGSPIHQSSREEATYLRALRTARTPVTYIEGTETLEVIVDRVGWQPGEAERWTNERDGFHGTLFVRLLTVA